MSAELPVLVVADSHATAMAAMQDGGLTRRECQVACSPGAVDRHIRGTRGRRYLLALRPGSAPLWWRDALALLTARDAVEL